MCVRGKAGVAARMACSDGIGWEQDGKEVDGRAAFLGVRLRLTSVLVPPSKAARFLKEL